MGRLDGKVALISGGARGQGAAEARMFAQEGAKIVIGDLLDAEGMAVAAEIAEAGGDALYVHLDVTSEDDWHEAIQTAVSSFGKLNVLVNNAAIWRRGPRGRHQRRGLGRDTGRERKRGVPRHQAGHRGNAEGRRRLNHQHLFHRGLGWQPQERGLQRLQGAVRLLTKATAVQYGRKASGPIRYTPGQLTRP